MCWGHGCSFGWVHVCTGGFSGWGWLGVELVWNGTRNWSSRSRLCLGDLGMYPGLLFRSWYPPKLNLGYLLPGLGAVGTIMGCMIRLLPLQCLALALLLAFLLSILNCIFLSMADGRICVISIVEPLLVWLLVLLGMDTRWGCLPRLQCRCHCFLLRYCWHSFRTDEFRLYAWTARLEFCQRPKLADLHTLSLPGKSLQITWWFFIQSFD